MAPWAPGFALWLGAWAGVAFMSLRPLPGPLPVSDKTAHLVGYATMSLLALAFCRRPRDLFFAAIATIAGGAIMETLQLGVAGRRFELADLGANAIGAGLGYLAARLLLKLRRRLQAA